MGRKREKGERGEKPFILLDKDMHRSPAFRSLTRSGLLVLLEFRNLCIIKSKSADKVNVRYIENNGKLRLTFEEADALGFSRASFARAIQELMDSGFLSIAYQGSGLHRDPNLYNLDDRWRKWGTPDFQPIQRPPPRLKTGFKKGHIFHPPIFGGSDSPSIGTEGIQDLKVYTGETPKGRDAHGTPGVGTGTSPA